MSVFDVAEAAFEQLVVARSRELPVVVDFWADWCGPCKQLTPVLEHEAIARGGKVELAKVDVDANQGLAARYRVQGIPSVKAFRDGGVVSEFTGALPPREVERFFDKLVPSEADELAERGDEESLRRAVEIDPRHALARRALVELLLRRGEIDEALELAQTGGGDFVLDALAERALLMRGGEDGLGPAWEAWDDGDFERALELLHEALADADDPDRRDALRKLMVGIFTVLGPESEVARAHRRRLAAALN